MIRLVRKAFLPYCVMTLSRALLTIWLHGFLLSSTSQSTIALPGLTSPCLSSPVTAAGARTIEIAGPAIDVCCTRRMFRTGGSSHRAVRGRWRGLRRPNSIDRCLDCWWWWTLQLLVRRGGLSRDDGSHIARRRSMSFARSLRA